jgi:hypothetical protein
MKTRSESVAGFEALDGTGASRVLGVQTESVVGGGYATRHQQQQWQEQQAQQWQQQAWQQQQQVWVEEQQQAGQEHQVQPWQQQQQVGLQQHGVAKVQVSGQHQGSYQQQHACSGAFAGHLQQHMQQPEQHLQTQAEAQPPWQEVKALDGDHASQVQQQQYRSLMQQDQQQQQQTPQQQQMQGAWSGPNQRSPPVGQSRNDSLPDKLQQQQCKQHQRAEPSKEEKELHHQVGEQRPLSMQHNELHKQSQKVLHNNVPQEGHLHLKQQQSQQQRAEAQEDVPLVMLNPSQKRAAVASSPQHRGPGVALRSCSTSGGGGVQVLPGEEGFSAQHHSMATSLNGSELAPRIRSNGGGGVDSDASRNVDAYQHQRALRAASGCGVVAASCSSGGSTIPPTANIRLPQLQSDMSVVSIEDLADCTGAAAAVAGVAAGNEAQDEIGAQGSGSPSVVELEARLKQLKASFDQVVTLVDVPKGKRAVAASEPGAVTSARQQQQQVENIRAKSSPGGSGYSHLRAQLEEQENQQGVQGSRAKTSPRGVGYTQLCQQQQQHEVRGQSLLTRGESGVQPKDLDMDLVEASLEGGMGAGVAVEYGLGPARPYSSQSGHVGPVEVSLVNLEEFGEEVGCSDTGAAAVKHPAGGQQQQQQGWKREQQQQQQQGSIPGSLGQQAKEAKDKHNMAKQLEPDYFAPDTGRAVLEEECSSLPCSSVSSMDWEQREWKQQHGQHGVSLHIEPSSSQLSSDIGEDLNACTSTTMVQIKGSQQGGKLPYSESSFLKRQEQHLQQQQQRQQQQKAKVGAKGVKATTSSRQQQNDQQQNQSVPGSPPKARSGTGVADAMKEVGRHSASSGTASTLQQLLASADELTGINHSSSSSSSLDHHALLVARQHAKQLQQNNDALISVLEDERATVERLRGQVRQSGELLYCHHHSTLYQQG